MIPKTYHLATWGFWHNYAIQMRPYLFFISGFAGMAGMALAHPQLDLKFWIAQAPFFLSYGFGQALTDCFQTDTDTISAPYRPLSQGIIRKSDVLWVSIAGLLMCIGVLFWLNAYNLVLGALSFFGLATYSFVKRNYWPLGPPYNALIVSFLPFMGYLCFAGVRLFELPLEVLKAGVILFMSYLIFVLMGYLKDISADRVSGYRTFPVVWGWDATVWVSDLAYAVSLLLLYKSGWIKGYAWLLFFAAWIVALVSQAHAHIQKEKTEENASFAIAGSVRFFILCCLVIISSWQPGWWPLLVSGYLFFEYSLYKRPEKTQL